MNKQNTLTKVFFYGSLRKGEYNYNAFSRHYGEENFQYQGTKTINGWKLYSLGAYPTILKSENPEDKLVVDEFLVSKEVFDSVRSMELGAGYRETQVDGAYIYHFEDKDKEYLGPRIEHGDWSKYLSHEQESYE